MSDTPRTDEAIERWRQGKVNILEEMAKLETDLNHAEAERIDLAKQLRSEKEAHAACQKECYNLQDQRDLALRMAKEREKERDQWKADCLEQCQLLAQSADREEKLIAKTGYWGSLIGWLEQVQEAFEGRDRDWDLNQVYIRGPFAGWSESDMVKLADKLWENEQKWPLRGDKK